MCISARLFDDDDADGNDDDDDDDVTRMPMTMDSFMVMLMES
jgi:hypothetical protein